MRQPVAAISVALAVLLAATPAAAESSRAVSPTRKIPGGADPVNPNASPEARALLKYLYSISGQYILAGQHNYPNSIARWTDRAYDLTGKYPALYGEDFGFSGGDDKDSVEARPAMLAEVERQWKNGAVVTLTWHAVRPTDDEPVTFRDSVQGHLTDFEWKELLTPGTTLYRRWCAQVDVIAGYLKQLQAARVPVLFRPYHEMNGNWFWWGGRPGPNGSIALYRQLYGRFVTYHGLDNIIWVWNVNAPSQSAGPIGDYFPGREYVDFATEDIYGEFKQGYYDDMLALAAGKPIALGEVGAAPGPDVLQAQPDWIYFMVWSDLVEWLNPVERLRAVYDAPNLLTRGDARLAGPMASIRQDSAAPGGVPVSPQASAQARALLARLYAGQGVLSGQENSVPAVSASSDLVFQATSKHPAIYGEELAITAEDGVAVAAGRTAIVDEARRRHRDRAIVSLTWRPAPPTEDEPASSKSIGNRLTDFEWRELLTPGTNLYTRWCAQVDSAAAALKALQNAGVPLLWQPYPDSNGKVFWWAGRKGDQGSAALYRQLFDRLVSHHGLHNLVWVWAAAPPGFGANAEGRYGDYFPGLVHVDALALNLETLNSRFRSDTFLARFAAGKPIGVGLRGKALPSPDRFAQQADWAWFLAAPVPAGATGAPEDSDALRALYADPHVLSLGGTPDSQ
jgi:mannan endo-1,4-beta-mannosidase